MTPDQRDLLEKAAESLAAAGYLLAGGYPDFAASRAYYAMFYVAEAALEGEGKSYSKHSAVIAGFGRNFVKTGRAPAEFQRFLTTGQALRHAGDYGAPRAVSDADAREQIEHAKRLLEWARETLGPIPE